MTDRKPFVITTCHKRNFRDWVREQFPELHQHAAQNTEYLALAVRLPEVHQAAMQVFDIIMTRSVPCLREYYAPDEKALLEDYIVGNSRAYCNHLNDFLRAIDVE